MVLTTVMFIYFADKPSAVRRRHAKSSSTSSTISANSMWLILDKLKNKSCRDTTNQTYLCIWRSFNNFVIKLDKKPNKWEDRVSLFLAHLIDRGMQSSTVKSYVSAIKRTLVLDGYEWDDSAILLSTLTRACRLVNDKVCTRLPIRCGLLELLLFEVQRKYSQQPFLQTMYMALFALSYYGLFRISELCITPTTNHAIKAKDVHVALNKEKILVYLRTSKTHGKGSHPQKIKITSNWTEKTGSYLHRNFCPFKLVSDYIITRKVHYDSGEELLFIFSDGMPLKAYTV